MELLRQMRQPSPGPCPSTVNVKPLISRAQTIQTLSLFISCLEWVSSEVVGMSTFHNRMCNIIKRILDRVLTPVVVDASSGPSVRQPEEQEESAMGASSLGFGLESLATTVTGVEGRLTDLLDWPECLDWDQESWMEVLEGSNFLWNANPVFAM